MAKQSSENKHSSVELVEDLLRILSLYSIAEDRIADLESDLEKYEQMSGGLNFDYVEGGLLDKDIKLRTRRCKIINEILDLIEIYGKFLISVSGSIVTEKELKNTYKHNIMKIITGLPEQITSLIKDILDINICYSASLNKMKGDLENLVDHNLSYLEKRKKYDGRTTEFENSARPESDGDGTTAEFENLTREENDDDVMMKIAVKIFSPEHLSENEMGNVYNYSELIQRLSKLYQNAGFQTISVTARFAADDLEMITTKDVETLIHVAKSLRLIGKPIYDTLHKLYQEEYDKIHGSSQPASN